MELLKGLRKKIHHFLLLRKAGQSSNEHSAISMEDAQSIGILFEADDRLDESLILRWAEQIKEQGKKVQLLAYVPHKLKDYEPPYPYFTSKSINWLYFSNAERVKQFADQKHDLLCCLFLEENLPLESIAALSAAKYRVGRFNEKNTHCFDFMIDLGARPTISDLIAQMNHFLTQMKTKDASAI